ncbi:uncharacterized protein [Amphiura filiformis]|uniref:uncharacterized protein n=1 Tax=Amphiura filiformis TaxID=82378 RepID=UPI003B21B234
MDEYEEYLEQLVVEVEGKVGTMPTCLRNPLRNDPSPTTSPFASPRMSTVDEGLCEERKSATKSDNDGLLERNLYASDEAMNGEEGGRSKGRLGVEEGSKCWKNQFSAFERSLQTLRDSMSELRNLDVDLARQLLSVNDSIEELKWINENYEIYDSRDSLIINSKSLITRYDSREQLHKRWVSERRLLATSSCSLNTVGSMSNLNLSKELRDFSSNLNRLNQNNNSNGLEFKEYFDEVAHVHGPDTSSILAEEFEYHPRSMSTSCTEKSSENLSKCTPLGLQRPASSTALVQMGYGPATSTPKTESKKEKEEDQEETNLASNIVDASSVDSSQISRVRVGSYGSQVRWHYRQTSEDEMFF